MSQADPAAGSGSVSRETAVPDASPQSLKRAILAAMAKLRLRTERVEIVEGCWQVHAYIEPESFASDGKDQWPILSPDLRGPGEVEHWANLMIRDLEAIKQKARRVRWDNRPSRPHA